MTKFLNIEHADNKMEGPSEDSGEETSEDMFFFTPSTEVPPKIKRRPNLKGVSLAEMSLVLILLLKNIFLDKNVVLLTQFPYPPQIRAKSPISPPKLLDFQGRFTFDL